MCCLIGTIRRLSQWRAYLGSLKEVYLETIGDTHLKRYSSRGKGHNIGMFSKVTCMWKRCHNEYYLSNVNFAQSTHYGFIFELATMVKVKCPLLTPTLKFDIISLIDVSLGVSTLLLGTMIVDQLWLYSTDGCWYSMDVYLSFSFSFL